MSKQRPESLRVVEHGHLVTAPYCAKLLADLGAEVIKVEDPPDGDEARYRGPFVKDHPGPERSLLFHYLNANKLGVTLNLEHHQGRDILYRLVKDADIFIDDTLPSRLQELGISYETLRNINDQLIVCSITPFGLSGPWKDFKAVDLNLYQAGGDGYLNPSGLAHELFPERAPVKLGGHMGDYFCGLSAAMGVVAALMVRPFLGRGQLVENSKLDAHVSISREQLCWYANDGFYETRETHHFAFGGCIPCKNGYVEVYSFAWHQWLALRNLLGNPEWAVVYQDINELAAHGSEVQQRLCEWARLHTKEWIYSEGQKRGAAIGMFLSPGEVVESDQERARGFFLPREHSELGRLVYPFPTFRLSASPMEFRRPAPSLGEHNPLVYQQRLGMGDAVVGRLTHMGVI